MGWGRWAAPHPSPQPTWILFMRLTKMILAALLIVAASAPAMAAGKKKAPRKAAAATRVIYTGDLAKKVYGYNGTTPLNITVKGGRITSIVALPNQESPQYFKKATAHVFPQFIGKTLAQAATLKADAATGATYSSKALIRNIQLGAKSAAKKK